MNRRTKFILRATGIFLAVALAAGAYVALLYVILDLPRETKKQPSETTATAGKDITVAPSYDSSLFYTDTLLTSSRLYYTKHPSVDADSAAAPTMVTVRASLLDSIYRMVKRQEDLQKEMAQKLPNF